MDQLVTIRAEPGTPAYPVSVRWAKGMTVHRALEAAYDQVKDTSLFSFGMQFFGTYQARPLGYMVVMMNGIYDSPGEAKYWAVLINGEYARDGIDRITLSPGDSVLFLNEPYSLEKHRDTSVMAKHQYHVALHKFKTARP